MKPSIGRIVHYKLTESDADAVNRRREHAVASRIAGDNTGAQVHAGNSVRAGDVYPAMIVRTWGDTEESAVQLQVFLDGNDTLWATSVQQGNDQLQWHEPERV